LRRGVVERQRRKTALVNETLTYFKIEIHSVLCTLLKIKPPPDLNKKYPPLLYREKIGFDLTTVCSSHMV
jgi:hypothetical protein